MVWSLRLAFAPSTALVRKVPRRPWCGHLLLVSLAAFCPALHLAAVGPQVWVVTETRHIPRSELPGKLQEARLALAKNERRSFQVLLRSDLPMPRLRLEVVALRGPAQESANNLQVQLFREHQLFLENGTYRNTDFKPDWYPDPLIPFESLRKARNSREAILKAIPFDVPKDETHAFWVDVYAPAQAVAGNYRGTIRITSDSGFVHQLSFRVTVWNFSLPTVPALETEFGSPVGPLRAYYQKRAAERKGTEPRDWSSVEAECAELLSEHRLNAVPPGELLRPEAQSDGSFRIPALKLQTLREFIDRYHVNAVQVPHPSEVVKDPDSERARLKAWLTAFDQAARDLNKSHLVFYTYLKDEPNTLEDYQYVQKWGRAVREANSVVKVLVVEQPWTAPGQGGADSAWGNLYGAVDIWCPLFSLHHKDSAEARQVLGERIWTYTALCQGEPTPWWHIDYPLLNYRVPTWIAWHDRICGLLYWGGLSYWGPVDDPWLHAPFYAGNGTFQQGQKGIVFYGEGSLVYPGQDVGEDGVVPTIRLKALRDAIEDYDYLALLDSQGKSAQAEAVVAPLARSFFSWEKNPAAFDQARVSLAKLILQGNRHR